MDTTKLPCFEELNRAMDQAKEGYLADVDDQTGNQRHTGPDPFIILVDLKLRERELADKVKLYQEKAIAKALAMGECGKIAKIDGATVTLKFVTVKPTSPMIKALKEDIDEFREELKVKNGDRLAQLEAEIQALTTDEEIQELEEKLEAEMAKMGGEKKPQIAVTLPK